MSRDVVVKSELKASVWQVLVKPGDRVEEDQELIILESMKTEIPVTAPSAGVVREVRVAEKDQVAELQVLVVIDG
ncbi:MAG TPA: acetyl-CoA carboxylase biotin carboxyl carrier protein subunit [Caulobacteraceae bacterium]|jgi:biotin carboxyl carrier protein|nr:acetyl-CoA carboxylase biotin carboxyl carrier protein subunit [Caulobacteraceae bacterium]